MDLHESQEEYSRVIHNIDDHTRLYLTINVFRGVEYLSIRKYYQDFDEEWKPTSEGINMPLDLNNSRELFAGLVEILSLAEAKNVIEENFKELIDTLYRQ